MQLRLRDQVVSALSMRFHAGSLSLSQCLLSLSPPMEGVTTAGLMTKASVWRGGPVLQCHHQQRLHPNLSPVALAHPDAHCHAPAEDVTDHETDRWND